MLIRIFFIIFIAIMATSAAFSAEEVFIGNVLSSGAAEHYTLVVDKIAKKLYMLKVSGDSHTIVDSTDILTGENEGSKQVEGDKRTPEGVYYITSYMTPAEMLKKWGSYAEIYGAGAYPTNYPNPIDKIMKRTGGGIWLHGLSDNRSKPATEGCVAMRNDNLTRMMPQLSIGMPMVTIDTVQYLNEAEYSEYRMTHLNTLNEFIKAWSYGDYDTFRSFIHPRYQSYAAGNAASYLASKKNLMTLYPDKLITVDNVNIYRQNETTIVYDINQFYCAPNVTTYGNKRYYMTKDNGTDKLISEEIFPLPVQPYLDSHVKQFVSAWQGAWQSKNADEYAKYYSAAFNTRTGWKEGRQRLFDSTSAINVGIENLRWEQAGGNAIKITFLQKYASDQLQDTGYKTLIIRGCPGSYTIQSEDWVNAIARSN